MPTKPRRRKTPWPLKGERYLSTPAVAPNSVSTGASVDTLRTALDAPGSGPFDGALREAVMDAQERLGLPVTGVVTEADWDAIVNPPRKGRGRRSAAPARRVDGAQEADGPAGELDAPQGPQ